MQLSLYIFIIVLFFVLKRHKVEERFYKRFIWIITIVLILVSCLRNKAVGSDTYRYILSLENSVYNNWSDIIQNFHHTYFFPTQTQKDPGYLLIEKAISCITTNQIFFLLIIAVVTLVPLAIFIYKNNNSKIGLVMSYLYFLSLIYNNIPNQIIRMSIAFSLVCLSYLSLIKNKNLTFFVLILVASTVHKSALILLLFWAVQRFVKVKYVFYLAPLFFFLVALAPNYLIVILEGNTGAYETYLHGDSTASMNVLVLMMFIYVIMLIGLNKNHKLWQENKLAIIGACFTFVLTPVVLIDSVLFRLCSYFAPWIMCFLPKTINAIPKFKKVIYLILLMAFLYIAIKGPEYKFVWEHMNLNDSY